jgi:diguanylate cyclase (GGDEF)-like protein
MLGETGIRDAVTGLYTRDYFDEIIGRELERSRRHDLALSVLSVVLVNRAALKDRDEEMADQALAAVGRELQHNVRETDHLFRWEDDELLVLLFEADAPAAAQKLQQLVQLFRPWRDGLGPFPVPIRVRLGGATHEKDIVFAAVLQSARAAARQQARF